ncbi:MAG: hypothetical protein Q8O91_10620 [Candidatus Aminicenantes bacterium]|nr:hypothetical protein [Candidatus Aminicenantes bacterium]
MKSFKTIAFSVILLSLLSCRPNIVPPGWDFLGKRQVSLGVDHDTVTIPPGARTLSRLLIVVRMNDLELYDIKVTFESGEVFDTKFRGRFLANRDTQIVDLPGGARRVRRVDFRYRSLLRTARRAEVELWGK